MGFIEHTSTPLYSIHYSAFMGALFLVNEQSRAAVAAYKAAIGEEVVKMGYKGQGSESTKAVATLRSQGVRFGKMYGRLTGVRLNIRDVNGRKTPYLSVTLTDDDGKYNLSVPVDTRGTQMLIRKLANAQPELNTVLSMFATYEQREGATQPYADHGASLKQGIQPVEVPVVSTSEVLTPRIEAAMSALTDAGVDLDDKETRGTRRSKIALEYHLDMLVSIEKRFSVYYDEREQSQQVSTTYGQEPADEYDDIPM